MAGFQIHEDIENIHSRLFAKKYTIEVEKKIVKKFGENNTVAGQPSYRNGGLKEIKSSKLPVINGKVGREQCKKPKIVTEYIKEEVSLQFAAQSITVIDLFYDIIFLETAKILVNYEISLLTSLTITVLLKVFIIPN